MSVNTVAGDALGDELGKFATAVQSADQVAAFNDDTMLSPQDRTAHTIERDGVLAALAMSHRLEDGTIEAELAVHPDHRRQGLGQELLGHLVATAREAGSALQIWAHGNRPEAAGLAARNTLESARTLYLLESDIASSDIDEPTLPSDVRIRTFDREHDGDAWVRLNAEVFATHPEQGSLTITDLDARINSDWFAADDFFVLENERGDMIGYNWLKLTPEEAEIYVIGVADSEAGRGFGTALMNAGMRHMREKGYDTAVLYVDGVNERALALYRRLGFTDRNVDVQYRRGA